MSESIFEMLERESMEWFNELLDAMNVGILMLDRNGIVRLVNKEYTNITGVQKEEIVGKYLPDVRPGAVAHKTLVDKQKRSNVIRQEGDKAYVADIAPIFIKGRLSGVVSVIKSVTEIYQLTKELQKSQEQFDQLKKTVDRLNRARYTFQDIIGEEPTFVKAKELAKRTAATNLNVLIQGESGTGKELFAHAIHNASARKHHPFIAVNCSAIPSSLLESELFGYEEGAFTDSKRGGKIGLFELADRGTIFLDEVGDMPYELQAKLLRVLQDGRIRKVGAVHEKQVDVRVIAATNKDLMQLIRKKRFREDLYYRLNGVNLYIPPLRMRKQDLPLLIRHIVKTYSDGILFDFSKGAMDYFFQYDWPGNIRELINVVHYAINMTDRHLITEQHLPDSIKKAPPLKQMAASATLKEVLDNTEREMITQALMRHGTDLAGKKKAAEQLGISLPTLYNKIRRLNIEPISSNSFS